MNGLLTGDEVVLKQLVDPLRWHHQAPLPVLEVLLAFVTQLSSFIYHAFHLIWMQRIEYFEEEVAFWQFTIILWKVVSDVWPIPNLSIDIFHCQPRPVRHGLGRYLFLSQAFLLAVQDGLEKDQLAF